MHLSCKIIYDVSILGFRSNFAYLEMLVVFVLHLRLIDTDDCGEIQIWYAFGICDDYWTIWTRLDDIIMQNYANSLV